MSLVNHLHMIKIANKLNERKVFIRIDTEIPGVNIDSVTIQENDFSGKLLYTTPSDFIPIGEVDSRPLGSVGHSPTLAFTFTTSGGDIASCGIVTNSTSFPKSTFEDTANGQFIFSDIIEDGHYTISLT